MDNQLKPCPFCSGTLLEVHGKPGILNAHDDVGCNSCHASAPYPTWNRRADDQAFATRDARIAELERVLRDVLATQRANFGKAIATHMAMEVMAGVIERTLDGDLSHG